MSKYELADTCDFGIIEMELDKNNIHILKKKYLCGGQFG